MITAQFARFLLAGGTAAGVNFGSRIVLSTFMSYIPAIVLAYCFGMATAFALNKRFVFNGTTTTMKHQVTWFVVVNLAAVAQTVLISLLFARFVFPRMGMSFHPETMAHALGVAVPVVTSYLGHKHISFRAQK